MGSVFSGFGNRADTDDGMRDVGIDDDDAPLMVALPKGKKRTGAASAGELMDTPGAINMSWGVAEKTKLLVRCADLASDFGLSSTGKTTIVGFSKGNRQLGESGLTVSFLVYRRIGQDFNESGLAEFPQGWHALNSGGAQNMEASVAGSCVTLRCELTSKPKQRGNRMAIATTGATPLKIGSSGIFVRADVFASPSGGPVDFRTLKGYATADGNYGSSENPLKRSKLSNVDFEPHFFPCSGKSYQALLNVLRSAKESIDCAVFLMTNDQLAQTLIQKCHEGVKVRIISDDAMNSKFKTSDLDKFREAGIQVRVDRSKFCMHHKFQVIDNRISVNGSFNWTKPSAMGLNRENIMICRQRQVVSRFTARFERLWDAFEESGKHKVLAPSKDAPLNGNCRVLFFPDEKQHNFKHYVDAMRSAKRTFDVAVFILTVREAIDAMKDARARGVKVRVITDDAKKEVHGGAHMAELKAAGIEVRVDHSSYNMHHKFGVIDGETVINGSFNWTRQAESANQEDCMVLYGQPKIAAAFTAEFDKLWAEFA